MARGRRYAAITPLRLLHAALREVIGTHVNQAGSLVAPDRLRFDFSHFAPLSDRALADIESLVNQKVLENVPVETDPDRDLDAALRSGAMALFGEKYGDKVRVVRIGDFSLELCGGTHCGSSGEIGLVKLVQERGIASGTRRVEAVSGEASLDGSGSAVDTPGARIAPPCRERCSRRSSAYAQLSGAQRARGPRLEFSGPAV